MFSIHINIFILLCSLDSFHLYIIIYSDIETITGFILGFQIWKKLYPSPYKHFGSMYVSKPSKSPYGRIGLSRSRVLFTVLFEAHLIFYGNPARRPKFSTADQILNRSFYPHATKVMLQSNANLCYTKS